MSHFVMSGVGGFQVFPPPSTPPEPAPPDLEPECGLKALSSTQAASRPRWQLQHGTAISSSLPTASSSHTSLDEAACMRSLSHSLIVRGSSSRLHANGSLGKPRSHYSVSRSSRLFHKETISFSSF